MKKLRILVAAVLMISTTAALQACDIFVTPSKSKVLVGDTITVKVKVHLIHRKCVLPIEETDVEATRGGVLGHTKWKKVSRMDYESVYKIVFYESGRNRILVTRECSRVGLSEGSGYVTATYNLKRALSLAKSYLKSIADGKRVRTYIFRLSDVLKWLKSQKELPADVEAAIPKLEAVVNARKDLQKAKAAAQNALNCKVFKEDK